MIHPAHGMTFRDLHRGLSYAVQEGLVHEVVGAGDLARLRLYNYSDQTVYERQWNPLTLIARGLILDVAEERIIATPFPKFFNHGEMEKIPDLPFEVFEKLDGSLIIIFWWGGRWRCATRGSFTSTQAQWAQGLLDSGAVGVDWLRRGTTYLAEAIYPENRIVVDYGDVSGLHLLGAYSSRGEELSYEELLRIGWPVAGRRECAGISELLAVAPLLSANEEGFVVRYSDGTRMKIKGDEYCRIHRLVTGLTPLVVWEMMRDAPGGLEEYRRALPEEFWSDFDQIVKLLAAAHGRLLASVEKIAGETIRGEMSDKDVGLRLDRYPSEVRRFIFPYRKGQMNDPRTIRGIFETFRPTGNRLEGYRSSSSIRRVQENL